METRRPVYSAALVLPFLIIYHAGTVILNTTYINGADALILRILGLFSIPSMFASVLVLILFFAVWQYRTKASLKINRKYFILTFLESMGLALILLLFFGKGIPRFSAAVFSGGREISDFVLYCGAGIYEELVFRALLLGILVLIFHNALSLSRKTTAILAAITGALIFSLFHYIGPAGDAFLFGSFIQRTLAGLYFSVIYVTRGFGITAACHAFYDILVGLLLF
jgi:membrane protease YdiL (CAAX protease family)